MSFGFGRKRGELEGLQLDDPRITDWEVVREFDELDAASAWRRHLEEAGIPAAITADQPPDRFGRGDIYLVVPPERWSDAEAFLDNLDLG